MRYVYLHGFASGPTSGKARYFQQRFADLGLTLDVPALDRGNFEGLTITGQLELIAEVTEGRPCVLIGSSLGGYLACLYAARHQQVSKLVLLAPAFRFTSHYPHTLGPAKIAEWERLGYMPVFHYSTGQEQRLGFDFFTDGVRYEPEPDFPQPALILHGTYDRVVPREFSIHYAASHPSVQYVEVASGHELSDVMPVLWEHTREFLKL